MYKRLLFVFTLAVSLSVGAREKLPAVALSGVLGSKVILEVDGQRHVLADGDVTEEGVTLLSHDHEKARIKIKGKRYQIKLGAGPVGSSYAARAAATEHNVYKDSYGMYRTVGLINGRTTKFLVDTGASSIAMSTRSAKKLGIDFIRLSKGQRRITNTANGQAYFYPVVLDSVSVGGIEAKFVQAAIIEGDATDSILLGMSYLGRLNISQQQGVMTFQTK